MNTLIKLFGLNILGYLLIGLGIVVWFSAQFMRGYNMFFALLGISMIVYGVYTRFKFMMKAGTVIFHRR